MYYSELIAFTHDCSFKLYISINGIEQQKSNEQSNSIKMDDFSVRYKANTKKNT